MVKEVLEFTNGIAGVSVEDLRVSGASGSTQVTLKKSVRGDLSKGAEVRAAYLPGPAGQWATLVVPKETSGVVPHVNVTQCGFGQFMVAFEAAGGEEEVVDPVTAGVLGIIAQRVKDGEVTISSLAEFRRVMGEDVAGTDNALDEMRARLQGAAST